MANTYIQTTDNNYWPSNAIALTKNQLLTDKVTMYTSGSAETGYSIKFSNGIAIFMKTTALNITTSRTGVASSSFSYWTCNDSTNPTVVESMRPTNVRFVTNPCGWAFAQNSTNIISTCGFRYTNDTTYGWRPQYLRLFCPSSITSLGAFNLTCVFIGLWKQSTTTNTNNTFITLTDDKKWTSNSIAFDNTGTTLKQLIANNTVEETSIGSDNFSGYIKFKDGFKICWQRVSTGTLSQSAAQLGYKKNFTPSVDFPCSFTLPPMCFVSSRNTYGYYHVPMSVFNPSTTRVGKIILGGENASTGCDLDILAMGV